MSNFQFGLWSGTAINDTSSVVAAAFSYSKAAGEMATIVKLTRALMIVPVCLGLIGLKWYRSKQQGRNKGMLKKIIPWFIIWFIVASILSSIDLVPKVVLPLPKGPFSPLYGHGLGRNRKQGFLETVPCSRSSPSFSRVDCLVLCSRI